MLGGSHCAAPRAQPWLPSLSEQLQSHRSKEEDPGADRILPTFLNDAGLLDTKPSS